MNKVITPNNVDVFNYLAIELLEGIGIENPTQQQIDNAEEILASVPLLLSGIAYLDIRLH